jgi:hypothetical protein
MFLRPFSRFVTGDCVKVYYGATPMRKLALAVIVLHSMGGGSAYAQTHGAGEGFVAVRGGANLVGNTYRFRETKPEVGAGGSIGAVLSPNWAAEFETWIRAANPECCGPRRRELLFSLSVVRFLAKAGLQPYMLGGLTLLRADDPEMQVQVGVGAQIQLYRRLSLAIDLRGNGGGSTMIVRPTAAAIYYFHRK